MPSLPSTIFRPGTIHLVMGTPGDAKYVEAIRIIRKTAYVGSKYQIFSPVIDPRTDIGHATFEVELESYAGYKPVDIHVEKVKDSKEILEKLKPETTTIGILGAHFFDMNLPDVVIKLKKQERFVVVAGVDKTYESDPFGPMGYLALEADLISKKYVQCSVLGCKNSATRTVKKLDGKAVSWGGSKVIDTSKKVEYSNVCLLHYSCEGRPEEDLIKKYRGVSDEIGSLIAFFGSMSSGKSEMMIGNVVGEAKEKGCEYALLKPKADTRTPGEIVSRTFKETGTYGIRFPAEEIDENNLWEFVEKAKGWKPKIIGIDEAQFIPDIIYFVNALRLLGHNVVVSGLGKDFKCELFGEMDFLICEATRAEPLDAICTESRCKNKATEVQRTINGEPAAYDSPIIIVEAQEGVKTEVGYTPRCLFHHEVPGKPEYLERKHRRKS